jgi:hypothetical protein
MGIVKISDDVHESVRTASQAMSRSINSQAEFWIKIGRLGELNPNKTFAEINQSLLQQTSMESVKETNNE